MMATSVVVRTAPNRTRAINQTDQVAINKPASQHELGYLNLRPEQTNIFFKLMEERYRQRPTIITTNLDYAEWANFLGNKALVEALLSRLRHQCHTVKIDGPTLRDSTG